MVRDAVEGGSGGAHAPPALSQGGQGGQCKTKKKCPFAVKMCPFSGIAPPALKSQRRPWL